VYVSVPDLYLFLWRHCDIPLWLFLTVPPLFVLLCKSLNNVVDLKKVSNPFYHPNKSYNWCM
jgi:hypothetical protein